MNRVGSCEVEGCTRVGALSRRMCAMHYRRFRVHGDPHAVWVMRRPCIVEECDQKSRARDMCTRHYQAWRSHGDPLYVPVTLAEQDLVPHGTPQGYNFHKCRCEACRDWKRPYARAKMLERYGITPDDYDWMLAEQGGVCAICREPEAAGRSLSVDHCHGSHKVRGLLCGRCNRAIGLLKDDPDRAMSAAAYLMQQVDVLGGLRG